MGVRALLAHFYSFPWSSFSVTSFFQRGHYCPVTQDPSPGYRPVVFGPSIFRGFHDQAPMLRLLRVRITTVDRMVSVFRFFSPLSSSFYPLVFLRALVHTFVVSPHGVAVRVYRRVFSGVFVFISGWPGSRWGYAGYGYQIF